MSLVRAQVCQPNIVDNVDIIMYNDCNESKEVSMIGTPVGKRVLLEMNTNPNETSSGIVLATTENIYFDNWKVAAIGPEVKDVNVGDIVYVDLNIKKPASWIMTRSEKHLPNEKVLFVEEDQIIAVLEN